MEVLDTRYWSSIVAPDPWSDIMRLGTQESTHRAAVARLAVTALAFAIACGGEGPTDALTRSVTRVELTIPDSSMLVGDSLVAQAVAFDSAGSPVPDATARWSSSNGSILLVSGNGVARGRALGVARIRATIGGVFAEREICVRRDAETAVIEAGDGQTATILTDAPVLPVVRFVDDAGLPVACLRVEILASPFADIAPRVTTTDADGRVRITRWRLGSKAGVQSVEFLASNAVRTTVRMTAKPGPPAKLTGPADMTVPGYMGQTLGRYSFGVTDVGDNPLEGVPVSFTAVGAKPALSASAATTNAGGTVGVDVRLDTVGTATITATAAGLSPVAFRVSATGFRATSIVMGGHRACASRADGAWYCWGHERDRPAPFFMLSRPSMGEEHLCGVEPPPGGFAYCAAGNRSGELGIGSASDPPPGYAVAPLASKIRPALFSNANTIFAGFGNTCALELQGQAWCWGSNANGVLGDPAARPSSYLPLRMGFVTRFQTLQMNRTSVCGIDFQSITHCWGRNDKGQLGDGTNVDRWIPVPVAFPIPFVSLSGGCGLISDGKAFCWGANAAGQLGDGTTIDRPVPTPVAGELLFRVISTGNRVNCGVATSGRIYCWGNGQLVPREVPLPNGRPAVAIATSEASVCAIDASDEVFCWGENDQHALGDGTTIDRSVPVPVLPAPVQ